jgi:hypothetical protein
MNTPFWLKLRGLSIVALLISLHSPSQAILDQNHNGLSDVWEKQQNYGVLFPNTFLAAADDDNDNWTNAQEAIAGTNPFDANAPNGIVAVTLTPSFVSSAYTLSWYTQLGKSYQLEASSDLINWLDVGMPLVEFYGVHSRGVNTSQPNQTIPAKVFWRVVVRDRDQDNDGLTDTEEHTLGTDVLNAETLRGVPDRWLAVHFYDSLLNQGVYSISLDSDLDNDGASAAEEQLNGTNPNVADPATSQRWLILHGDSVQNVEKTRTKTITIPKGTSALFIVAIASEEYEYYTDPENTDEFDDQLRWNITSGNQPIFSGEVYVNDRHFDWIIADINQQSIPGINKSAHFETVRVITAPADADLEIDIEIGATNIGDDNLPSHIAIGYEPFEINSLDRFVKGSIQLSTIERFFGGEAQFGLQLVGKTSEQTLGRVSIDDAYIHSEGYLNSNAEAAQPLQNLDSRTWQQEIIYYISEDKLYFTTTFDQIETLEIKFYQDSEEKGKGEYTLTALPEVAKLIQTLDKNFREAPFANNGVIPPQYIAANNVPEYEDIFSEEEEGEEPVALGSEPEGFTDLQWRNLTTRCMNEAFEAIKDQVPIIIGQIAGANEFAFKQMVAFANGYTDGIWGGLKSDWAGLVEVKNLLAHPIDTAQATIVGFKEMLKLTSQQWKDIGQHMFASMITASKEALPWELKLENAGDVLILETYVLAYGQGFVTEQACMVFLGAGAVSKIGQTVKVILQSSKLGRLGIELAAKGLSEARNIGRKTKTSAQRYWSQFARNEDEIRDITAQLEDLHRRPGSSQSDSTFFNSNKGLGEALEELENLTQEKLLKELGDENTFRALQITDIGGRNHVNNFQRRASQLATTLLKAEALSEDALIGFARLYKRLIKNDDLGDDAFRLKERVRDLTNLFDTRLANFNTDLGPQRVQHTKALAKSLEAYKTATDTDINAKFWFKDVDKVYDALYHHFPSTGFNRLEIKNGNVYLKEFVGERGWYTTANKLDTQASAQDVLQLPTLANGRYRCKFSTTQIKDNLKVPQGDINVSNIFEPLTKDFPQNGIGNGKQLLLEGKEALLDEVFDTVENRILTTIEIENLIGG